MNKHESSTITNPACVTLRISSTCIIGDCRPILGRDGFRVEHRTALSCSKLEIFEFESSKGIAKIFVGLDSIRVRSSRGVCSTRTRYVRLEKPISLKNITETFNKIIINTIFHDSRYAYLVLQQWQD